ncbi:hypothetical protein PRZ48_000508 [Zasmidium cellare]|uniref:Uncharacterized protein n=1 Tax=Zasmidium cellare TaxID=395010 RepID=A0ABR0F0C6_ZASCE|nr:hypothetical protein PRZ48_000508 [Zasmidium cellare]
MTSYHTLRLTPSNSPFFKSPSPRSPTKQSKQEEPGLHLRKVIGTTTASAHAFDCLSSSRKFAFTAGAAAVVATVDEDLNVTQHFFRGNPSSYTGGGREAGNGGWPLSPSPHDPRFRGVKEQAAGGSPTNRDWSDSPGRSTSAKDRVKAATSVALSPNGRWLAVGETGYRPRILIFSARDGSSESPVSVLAEHTFGVHALSFSPDSRSLASLGTVNDGFLYVWNIDERTGAATLSASNKCTSIIHSMAWMGRSIVTAGLRYVKVWRPEEDMALDKVIDGLRSSTISTPRNKNEPRQSDFGNSILSPKHRALAGKNSLLGDLQEATFASVIAISESRAIVCTEAGDICLLDDSGRTQTLSLAANAGIRISAVRIDENSVLHAVGPDGGTVSFLVPDLERRAGSPGKPRQPSSSSIKSSQPQGTVIVAFGTLGDAVVEIDSDRVIRLYTTQHGAGTGAVLSQRQLTAHEDAVLGVRPIRSPTIEDAAFFTFSGHGTIHFWDSEGVSAHDGLKMPVVNSAEMYGLPNELKSVEALADGTMLASGDKYGSLAVVEIATGTVLHQVRAHSAEVLDLVSFERAGVQYLASASRDRTVQLFVCRDGILDLIQTMDEHAGAVTGLLLSRDGDQLLSCSADRSIVVRQRFLRDAGSGSGLAFGMLRAITLKSSPTSMCLTTQRDTILVSTIDRCIGKYSTKSGQPGFSFKCSDNDGGEAAVMSKILYSPSLNGNPTIAGVSSSDKSVRLYSEYGSLIARDWGHTEGITDMAFVSAADRDGERLEPPKIATVAADSTIFLWDSLIVSNRSGANSADSENVQNGNLSTPLGPPLRKVISHSEMSRFRREKSTDDHDSPSPPTNPGPAPPSPQKVRKKTSRLSLAQTPRLEPGNRPNFDPSRRRSLRQRSPSPPSPRNPVKKDTTRRQTLGMSLRSKSSENILNTGSSSTGFGTLTSSTESVCRTLRAYRKKLSNTATTDSITPEALRELEKELKLTARVVGEKSQGKTLDEATIAKLLDQASDKIVGLLDEKIKARVEGELRRGDTSASTSSTHLEPPAELDEHSFERSETAPGALESQQAES